MDLNFSVKFIHERLAETPANSVRNIIFFISVKMKEKVN